MFQKADGGVTRFVSWMESANLKFCHACHFQDFISYVHLGGVPSRYLLETSQSPYTSFLSDESDKKRNLWPLVFGNLTDFGRTFEYGGKATPNIYGQILIRMKPEALLACEDIAVATKALNVADFDRVRHSYKNVGELSSIYNHETRRYAEGVVWPDISCTVPGGLLSFSHATIILVDDLVIHGKPLIQEVVAELKPDNPLRSLVKIRRVRAENAILYRNMSKLLCSALSAEEVQHNDFDDHFKKWSASVPPNRLNHYLDYARRGTVRPIGERNKDLSISS